MPGKGIAPKPPGARRRANTPTRGEWRPAPGVGWQHGPIPEAPDGIGEAASEVWRTWMRAWFAAHWTPGDIPGLSVLIRLYDLASRPNARAAYIGELRAWADTYGVTPKGQQDRRWTPPATDDDRPAKPKPTGGRYGHLLALDDHRKPGGPDAS